MKGVVCNIVHAASPVRLVSSFGNPANLSSGRLEIFINSTWGTVCDNRFGIEDADIACRELGFDGGNSYTSASVVRLENNDHHPASSHL